MYAGVPGRGASDASYATAVDMEYYRCCGHRITGGVADIFKCFDQLVRRLVFELMRLAGMPLRILHPYADFLTGLIVYNGLVGCLGQPHKRKCGIPQGCPLSMMVIGILMIAWITIAKSMQLQPRVLADDILIFAHGANHLRMFQLGFELTLDYIADLGGKTAPKKSIAFSTHPAARHWLRNHVWDTIHTRVKVALHVRDLGAHFNISGKAQGGTFTARLKRGAVMAKTVARLPTTLIPCMATRSSQYISFFGSPLGPPCS